ncbi:MAG: Plug domain-containing protein [Sulfurimonas sp.]|nr:Plug domain-containing protein [Sulfurimonas sp.]MDD3834419.1 Plug domain-containing protein [Sulfurimonas sp.]
MKSALALICVTSLLLAEEVRLDPISVEDRMTNDTIFVANEEDFLTTRSIYLQDKLERDVSFTTVADPKGEVAVSFRGLDFKNTNYVEDGIPLYRGVSGLVDTGFNMNDAEVKMHDGSGTSSLGVSSAGGEVEIRSVMPRDEVEMKLKSSISNSDEYYHAHLGSSKDSIYIQTEASYYYRSAYKLSDDYVPT